MKRKSALFAPFFFCAAFTAHAIPQPTATMSVAGIDPVLSAVSAIVAEAAGKETSEELVSQAREAVSATSIVSETGDIRGAIWIETPIDDELDKFAALVSIPAKPDALKAIVEMLQLDESAVEGGVCREVPNLPFKAAFAVRDGRVFVAAAAPKGVPDGIPGDPADLLDAVAEVLPAARRPDALFEGTVGREAFRAIAAKGAADDDSIREMANVLREHLGVADAAPALRKYFEAAAAETASVVGETFDVWFDPGAGLVFGSFVDLDPASALARKVSAAPALDPASVPADVPPGAFAWCVGNALAKSASGDAASELVATLVEKAKPDATGAVARFRDALAKCVRASKAAAAGCRSASFWIAPDSLGRPCFSWRWSVGESGADGISSARKELFEAFAALVPSAGIAVSGDDASASVSIPVRTAFAAACPAGMSADCGPAAVCDAVAFAERFLGATNVISTTCSGGTASLSWRPAGAVLPDGSAPRLDAALALAARAGAGFKPGLAGEASFSGAVKRLFGLFPEAAAVLGDAADAVLAGIPEKPDPARFVVLHGENRVATIASVPMSDLKFFALFLFFGVEAQCMPQQDFEF